MRIIGNIEDPNLKITVFRMDNRTSVKFETAQYEQTLKLGDDERFATIEGVCQLVDKALIEKISEGFSRMHGAKLEALTRAFPVAETEMFEEII